MGLALNRSRNGDGLVATD